MLVKQRTNVAVLCGVVFGVRFRRKSGLVSLAAQRFYAMIVKHATHSWRNRFITLYQLLCPVFFVIPDSYLFNVFTPASSDPPALSLDLNHFDKPTAPFIAFGANGLADRYSEVAGRYGEPVSVTSSNMDDYLLEIAERSLRDYNRKYIVAGTVNSSGVLVGHFNNFALHSIAVSLSLADNALLRHVVSRNSRIVTINHPLPRSLITRTKSAAGEALITGFKFGLIVTVGLAFVASSFVMFVVKQRSNKAKHSQFVSGVGAVCYWLAALVWDLLCFAVSSILILFVVLAFQTEPYCEWPVFG